MPASTTTPTTLITAIFSLATNLFNMKKFLYLLILTTLFACGTSKKTNAVASWHYTPSTDDRYYRPELEVKTNKIGKLDNGDYVVYHLIDNDSSCCPNMLRLGRGQIYSISGVIQSDTSHYFFFWPETNNRPMVEYEYFYYSYQAEMWQNKLRESARQSGLPNNYPVTTVDGVIFTCQCPPAFIDSSYRKQFPDVALVKVLSKKKAEKLVKSQY